MTFVENQKPMHFFVAVAVAATAVSDVELKWLPVRYNLLPSFSSIEVKINTIFRLSQKKKLLSFHSCISSSS